METRVAHFGPISLMTAIQSNSLNFLKSIFSLMCTPACSSECKCTLWQKTGGTQAFPGKETTPRLQKLIILKMFSTTNFKQVSSQDITGFGCLIHQGSFKNSSFIPLCI